MELNLDKSGSFVTYSVVTKVVWVRGILAILDSCAVLYLPFVLHCRGAINQWGEMNCTRISQTECSLPWSLKERRWTLVLRVRAELGQVTSDWVETDPFVAERNSKFYL